MHNALMNSTQWWSKWNYIDAISCSHESLCNLSNLWQIHQINLISTQWQHVISIPHPLCYLNASKIFQLNFPINMQIVINIDHRNSQIQTKAPQTLQDCMQIKSDEYNETRWSAMRGADVNKWQCEPKSMRFQRLCK